MMTLTLTVCVMAGLALYRVLDSGAPAGWMRTLPVTVATPAPAPAGNPCWSCSGTIESDDLAADLVGAWATPTVCATVPVTVLASAAPARADVRAMVEATPVIESRVGALCYGLNALVGESTDTSWTLVDRFTGAVKARVEARIVRAMSGGRSVQVTAEVL